MKKINYILLITCCLALSNCTQHSVKFGKKCTQVASDGTYEKSYVWVVNSKTVPEFDKKITKENCLKAENL